MSIFTFLSFDYRVRDSIVVSISACHADDPGSIPGRGVVFSAQSGGGPPLPPLGHFIWRFPLANGPGSLCSLAVEHPLSKREVVGSNPAIGYLPVLMPRGARGTLEISTRAIRSAAPMAQLVSASA